MQKTPHSKIQLYGHPALKRIITCTEPVTDGGGHTGHVTFAPAGARWRSERFTQVPRWASDTTLPKTAPKRHPAGVQRSIATCSQQQQNRSLGVI